MAAPDEDLVRLVARLLRDPEFRRALLVVVEDETDPATRRLLTKALRDSVYSVQSPSPTE